MKCDIFNTWVTYRNDLKGYVKKRVPYENDVDEILQSVLIKITNYCESKNDVKYLKAWIYKITQHTIADFYKQSNRTTKIDLEYLHLQNTPKYDESIYIWLYNFIDNLPPKYSIPLKLSDIEGKPQKEIADQLGLALATAKSRIQRARKMVKSKFNECGVVEHSENKPLAFTITKHCCMM